MGTDRIDLSALDGANPLAYLAALGLLSVGERVVGHGRWRLGWTTTPVSTAFLTGAGSRAEVVEAVLADRDRWRDAPALEQSFEGDVKFPDRARCREYLNACLAAADGDRSIALAAALVAEGSTDNNGNSKPSDLHFTAGQQRLIKMIREVRDGLSAAHIEEALWDGWEYTSKLPSLKWDVTDDRAYAYGADNPAATKKLTVPGAEWLGVNGLCAYPVFAAVDRRLRTTGCQGGWKTGTLRWQLWSDPKPWWEAATVVQLLGSDDRSRPLAVSAGVFRIWSSSIRRSDQGGYGSFSPPTPVWERSATAV